MAIKNQSVVVEYIDWDTSANDYKTGDVGNHTIYNTLDGVASAAVNSPAEVDATNRPGLYTITLTAGETNGNTYGWGGKSSTGNVVLFGLFAITERSTIASLGTQVTSVGTLTTSVGVAVSSSETVITTATTSIGTRVGSVGTQTNSVGTLTTSVGTAVASSETVLTTEIASVGALVTAVGILVNSVGTQTASVGTLTTSVGVAVASSETIITTAISSTETIITTATTSIGTRVGSVGTLTTSVGVAVASSETIVTTAVANVTKTTDVIDNSGVTPVTRAAMDEDHVAWMNGKMEWDSVTERMVYRKQDGATKTIENDWSTTDERNAV